ncbi:hypothetical protein KEJ47_08600 [Candidatus Bathyarchaeota archaeon]|nr:hypothetical protein [Candidatus Bathyarchaeota archaeon]
MSEVLRKEVVYLITAIVVITMIADYFFGIKQLNDAASMVRTWAVVISAMALALGAVNLMRAHGNIVRKRVPGRWIYSGVLIFIFALTTLLGLLNINNPSTNPLYKWLFDYPYTSLGQTLYAITGFYIASAAYRAFRARNIDAALLLLAGIFVLLKNAPIGEVIWVQLPVIGGWFNDIGQVPAMRTFLITAAFGLLAYGFRTLLGKERGFYGEVATA